MSLPSLGHPVWSQSSDNGRTWSTPKLLLDRDGGTAFKHPRSPCPIYDLNGPEARSGKYFALIHNTFDFDGITAYQIRGPLYKIESLENEATLSLTQGYIALQSEGGPLAFRNIYLE